LILSEKRSHPNRLTAEIRYIVFLLNDVFKEERMPTYYYIMGAYTMLSAFVVFIVTWNLFTCKDFWEQVASIFVLVPFILRMLLIK